MLNTIKSKISFLTVFTLLVLSVVSSFFQYVNFKKDKDLTLDNGEFTIATFAEQINKQIITLENQAKDLALLGEVYYQTGKKREIADYLVTHVFDYYRNALGGGIWFEPYKIDPNRRLSCTYAFQNQAGNIVIDRNFESENYNYLEQSWYKEIAPSLSKTTKVAWSRPYNEKQGSLSVMTTVGAGIYDQDKLIGISTVDWKINAIIDTVSSMRPTPHSFALFGDKKNDFVIVTTSPNVSKRDYDSCFLSGKACSLETIPWYKNYSHGGGIQYLDYLGKKYVSYNRNLNNGMFLIINVPEDELYADITKHLFSMLCSLTLLSIAISVLIYVSLKRNINKPIDQLTKLATEIGNGNLDAEVKLKKPKEFADLAYAFNQMTHDIKNYIVNLNKITYEKEKIESELSIAKKIQSAILPTNFDLNHSEFDIFATMNTAKEVGGDFYDFFFIDPTHFMFLIADVSGKGVPAALFMMTGKTMIKNLAKEGYTSVADLFKKINNKICKHNKEEFFITLFAGILDLNSGVLTVANCGHNPPLMKKDRFEFIRVKANLVLGAMSDIKFKTEDIQLNSGDVILLYTDGVTEAMNVEENLYGEERLHRIINDFHELDVKNIINDVKEDVFSFIGTHEQSDDITMLALKYNGKDSNKIFKSFLCKSEKENLLKLTTWLEELGEKFEINPALIMKLNLIAEEIFINIVNYAYQDGNGDITVNFSKEGENLNLQFIDNGIPYDPLANSEPDITLEASKREIGGLGIFMVKKSADQVTYNHTNGKNILNITLKNK